MLTIFLSILAMLFLFGITIFVHEFGHFIVARKCGLVVETFSIGMGPALWRKEIGGVTYKIGAFPIGGYVSLPQLDPEGMEKIQGENENDRKKLPEISPWKKIAVAASGPLCNVVFGILLAWIVYIASYKLPTLKEQLPMIGVVAEDSEAYAKGIRPGDIITKVNGKPVDTWHNFLVEGLLQSGKDMQIDLSVKNADEERTLRLKTFEPGNDDATIVKGIGQAIPCLLGAVEKDSPAEKAGLKASDIVVEFNEETDRDWYHFTDIVQSATNQTVSIAVKRDGQRIETEITPEYNEKYERIMVGVGLGSFRTKPMDQVKNHAFMVFRVLKGLVTPKESGTVAKNLSGPVGIFNLLWNMIQIGFVAALSFTCMININLAILNLLPIPVLDGGHICFSLWEGITRRRVPAKVISILVQIFAVLLIGAMLLLTWRDFGRVFKKAPTEQVDKPAEKPEAADGEAAAQPSAPAAPDIATP